MPGFFVVHLFSKIVLQLLIRSNEFAAAHILLVWLLLLLEIGWRKRCRGVGRRGRKPSGRARVIEGWLLFDGAQRMLILRLRVGRVVGVDWRCSAPHHHGHGWIPANRSLWLLLLTTGHLWGHRLRAHPLAQFVVACVADPDRLPADPFQNKRFG